MPLAINSTTLAKLNAGLIADRGLMLFELNDRNLPDYFGFWTGQGPLDFNGVIYVGAGSLIEVDAFPQVTDGSSVPVTARLTSIPNSDLTPDILATIEQQQYHQRPVTIMTAYFDMETREMLSVEVEYRGIIDKIEHHTTVGGEAVLVGYFESRSRDFLKKGYRMRTDADQRTFEAADGSLRHVQKTAVEKIYFGKSEPKSAAQGAAGPATNRPDFTAPGAGGSR